MKYKIPAVFVMVSFVLTVTELQAQKVYGTSSGEMILQSAMIEQNGDDVNSNLRFTLWFHAGEYVHLDAGNNIGFFSGMGIRNVGFITSENDIKTKYRSYNLGIPLAIKLGSFKDHFYVYGGGEYEWMFHFKQKTIIDDEKLKYRKWFSDRTPSFIPSFFAGIQFPKGLNVKLRYYLDNFLNHDYQGSGTNSDYTSFEKTQVWYISLSFQIKNEQIKEFNSVATEMASR
ncbi:MAG TPA: hypothetical protein VJ203_07285 [Bacteroidales bacterium]|nr:hypothetical protein [Bacteroidales bacterium]